MILFSYSILSLWGTCEIASMFDLGGHQRLSSASFSVNATSVYLRLLLTELKLRGAEVLTGT